MNKRKAIALCAAAGVALSVIGVSGAANAEPVSNSYSIVGSDTLQDVVNALANGTNISGAFVRSTADGVPVGSFDATGATLIQTKSGGPRFGRPNGSGDGVTALSRSIDGAPYRAGTPGSPQVTITGQVDIARSSSGPSAIVTDGPLAYIPFGRDALAYAHTGAAATLGSLSLATLTGIFDCSITSVGGVDVTPVIPQAGSGTRNDWLARLGLTTTYASGVPSCVEVGQEHDTSFLADGSTPFPANGITPMSAAQWVAQNTGAGIDRRGANALLGTPVSGVSPVNGTGASMAPNPAYYANGTWGRDTYLVVEAARLDDQGSDYDPVLDGILNPSSAQSLTNSGSFVSTAGAVKVKFGFLPPSSTAILRAALR